MPCSEAELYRALFDLSRSISGRLDFDGLCDGLAEALRHVVKFENLGLMLYEPDNNILRLHGTSGPPADFERSLSFPIDEGSPAGWVFQNQRSLSIRSLSAEERWPEFRERMQRRGFESIKLLPLTHDDRRIGVLGFGGPIQADSDDADLAFLERVACEFAVAVDAYLTRQELLSERDRLRVLFEVTNALVSKLSPEELFAAISAQLHKVVAHHFAMLTLVDKNTGQLAAVALQLYGDVRFDSIETTADADGLPAGEALATRRPVVLNGEEMKRFHSPVYQRFLEKGFNAACSIPLVTPNEVLGTLEIARVNGQPFICSDVQLLFQVAGQIAIALENSLAYRELREIRDRLANEKLYLEDELRADLNAGNMIGSSEALQSVLRSIEIVAKTDATVLILGETGTGKELVARAIHDLSNRATKTFVKLNCAAIPATLLESELFGHEKGAFTGAVAQKPGRFELANGGTIFLDEVAEIPLDLQAKLLRVIQEQEFERLGGTKTMHIDVRFIAATNRNLKQMVDEGRFRNDLYYRLHVFPLFAPALRDRKEDIPLLARYFTQKYAQRLNRSIESIPASALDRLIQYDWPGNIRELQNVIERSVILSMGSILQVSMPHSDASTNQPVAPSIERERILRALREADGIVGGASGAAARLGIKRTTLQSRLKRLGITREYS